MVQIIEENRKPTAAERFNQSLNAGMSALTQQTQRMQQDAENEALKNRYGVDLSGIYDPDTRQKLITDELTYGRKMKQAEASKNVKLMPDKNKDFTDELMNERTPLPEFEYKGKGQERTTKDLGFEEPKATFEKSKSKKSKVPFASIPPPLTQGDYRPVMTPEQIIQELGPSIAAQSRSNGIPMDDQEGIKLAQYTNQQNQSYNDQIDKDISTRQQMQTAYGNKGVEKLRKIYQNPSDDLENYMRREAQKIASDSADEADIEQQLTDKAKSIKHTISQTENGLPARRSFNIPKYKMLGVDRSDDKKVSDLRLKLQPLLKEGLFDTARNVLSKIGYYPEEREHIISSLGEGSKKSLATLPQLEKKIKLSEGYSPSWTTEEFTPENKDLIKNNMLDVFKSEPSVNLLLLRRGYEDKGVDWSTFKDILNDAALTGQINLNPEQLKMLDLLDEPPLNNLEKILEKIKFIGR